MTPRQTSCLRAIVSRLLGAGIGAKPEKDSPHSWKMAGAPYPTFPGGRGQEEIAWSPHWGEAQGAASGCGQGGEEKEVALWPGMLRFHSHWSGSQPGHPVPGRVKRDDNKTCRH